MNGETETVGLERDVEATVVPSGTRVTLQKGETTIITQSLGGMFTVVVNGNMFHINGADADALGREPVASPAEKAGKAESPEDLEKQVWDQMKTCYDPEIPVNIVDLGLIYDCHVSGLDGDGHKVDVKMTLTAPGCGMGPMIAQQAEWAISELEGVEDVEVEMTFDPPWSPDLITEDGKKLLGID